MFSEIEELREVEASTRGAAVTMLELEETKSVAVSRAPSEFDGTTIHAWAEKLSLRNEESELAESEDMDEGGLLMIDTFDVLELEPFESVLLLELLDTKLTTDMPDVLDIWLVLRTSDARLTLDVLEV
jgi:hypothetical protein